MKRGKILFLAFAGFLTLYSCTNIFMERLFEAEKETDTPLTVTYTVSFNTNGGSPVPSQKVAKGGKAIRPDNPTKVVDGTEYGFVNWYNNAEFAEPPYNFATPVTADITLYAKWSTTTYTVSFESNGGSPVASQTIGEGGTASRPTQDPIKDGYEFDDWYFDPDLTVLYDFDTPVTENIELYAKWIPVYTVTFNSNGGSPVPSQKIREGGRAIRPDPDPVKGDDIFDGWYSDPALTELFDFDAAVNDHLTLYAKWIPVYTVSFESNGGSPVPSQKVAEGKTATHPPNPTKIDGDIVFGFMYWYRDEALSVLYDFDDPVFTDITLYADWNEKTHTVSFESNGGSPVPSLTVGEGGTASRPPDPTKESYIFDNWYRDEALSILYDFNTRVTEDIDLYANWIPVFTVTFHANAGVYRIDDLPDPITEVRDGATISKPPDPTRVGYTFVGWYKEEEGINEWDFDTDVVIADTTLYAKWDIIQYTVSFEANGGTPAPAQQIVDHGDKVSEPSAMTKAGYSFGGWYTEAAFTHLWDFDAETVTANLTLYAKWTPNTAVIAITVKQITDQAPDIPGGTISRGGMGGYPESITFVLDDPGVYDSCQWSINRVGIYAGDGPIISTESYFEVSAYDEEYNSPGNHVVYLLVYKDGVPYSKTIVVTIVGSDIEEDFGPGASIDGTFNVTNDTDWTNAKTAISGGGSNKNYVINVMADIPNVAGSTANSFGSANGINVSLWGVGADRTLTISNTGNADRGNLIRIVDNQTVILRDLTLQGRGSNNTAVVYLLANGTFVMQQGGKISGNTNTAGNGSGVRVEGTFTMNGGEISGNSVFNQGGGVYTSGAFRIVTGTIYGNETSLDTNLRNIAANGPALFINSQGGTAERGTFSGDTWTSSGTLATTNGTIRVVEGVLIQ